MSNFTTGTFVLVNGNSEDIEDYAENLLQGDKGKESSFTKQLLKADPRYIVLNNKLYFIEYKTLEAPLELNSSLISTNYDFRMEHPSDDPLEELKDFLKELKDLFK